MHATREKRNAAHKTETNNGEFPNGRQLGHGVRNRGHRHGLLETGAALHIEDRGSRIEA
jgi:hypothetical protein